MRSFLACARGRALSPPCGPSWPPGGLHEGGGGGCLVQPARLHAPGQLALLRVQRVLRRLELGQQGLGVPGMGLHARQLDALLLVDHEDAVQQVPAVRRQLQGSGGLAPPAGVQ